jgi:AbrB family looped-hinge helix DNA binding protein
MLFFALHTDIDREAEPMTTLTVTARGQVTFLKDVLQHLGIRPGEKIELDKQPDGAVVLRPARPDSPSCKRGNTGLIC